MTVAGFTPDEIELVQHGSTLLVSGQKAGHPEVLHQGIPLSFRQSFNLADHVKVVGATVEHGLLIIDLTREVPEAMKPRRIQINSGVGPSAPKQANEQKQIQTGVKNAA